MKYNLEEKYIDFALKNYTYNKDNIDNNTTFGPVRLELLLSTYKAYNYAKTNNPNNASIKNFNINELSNSIDINFEVLFNYYVNEETSMYFNNEIALYGFHDIDSNFRMRIDDIQHSILGIMMYSDEILNM